MQGVRDRLKRVAKMTINTLILGEVGVGKCFAARTIHKMSGRKGTFVAVDCGEPEGALERRLFGEDSPGDVEVAAGGTLFLSEVGKLSLRLQGKLLRTLETRESCRQGETTCRRVNFRLLGSSSQDVGALVRAGAFRSDLFFRLDGCSIEVPPLRHRWNEIPMLVSILVQDLGGKEPHRRPVVTAEAMQHLVHYAWPG